MTEASLSRSSTRSTNYSTCPPSRTLSDSNNSLIFERDVEDPGLMTSNSPSNSLSKHGSTASLLSRQYSNQCVGPRSRDGSTTLPHSPPLEGHSPEYVKPSLDHRRTLENFVAPALDAGCSVVTDDNANLDEMDIVYMRRPSTIGLDMALGRTKSNSSATITSSNNNNNNNNENGGFGSPSSPSVPPLSLSRSYSNSNCTQPENPRTLRFYSYVDMLSDEMAHNSQSYMRKPALSYSFSSSHIRSGPQRPAVTANFSNPFVKRRDSSAGSGALARRYSNTLLTRSPTTPASSYSRPQQPRSKSSANVSSVSVGKTAGKGLPRSGKSNFHIESSGSDELSTDDDEEMPHHSSLPPPASHTLIDPRISRTSTHSSINNGNGSGCSSPLFATRTYSNTGISNTLGGPSIIRRRESAGMFPQPSINNVLMYDDTLQTEKVGEALKRRINSRKDSVSTNN
ncbi:hypothetical protein HG536_0B02800 [Torulaspora globosa]|uniref:Uncharacterized protein n=1 Tax=Torulaspora globosa TaxID=48254 RepID=A0A7G3ZD31_9SACH|nr:uncharacterized protein HG536_0B02800 [Torulaspora globosa]QLL31417.1 hypothetical protein HG536_0B02800 [Torulaspora globosa]